MNDEILTLLDLMRVRGTTCVSERLTAPWKVHIEAEPALTRFHLVLAGCIWIGIDGAPNEVQLCPGDMVIIPNGKAYAYSDRKCPQRKIGKSMAKQGAQGSETTMLCGEFRFAESTPPVIVSRLPDMLVERGGEGSSARGLDLLMQLIKVETGGRAVSPQCVLNRLTEILCLHAIQNWLRRTLSHDEALRALADPRINAVMDKIHSEPTQTWTVDSLARVYGQSRAAFAAHFKFATGQSPITYVRQCRIKRACEMLEETALPVDEVAYMAGYSDTNAFNRAFRRETGASPGAYRRMPRL